MIDWTRYIENIMQENNRLWQGYVAVSMENVMLNEKIDKLERYIKSKNYKQICEEDYRGGRHE